MAVKYSTLAVIYWRSYVSLSWSTVFYFNGNGTEIQKFFKNERDTQLQFNKFLSLLFSIGIFAFLLEGKNPTEFGTRQNFVIFSKSKLFLQKYMIKKIFKKNRSGFILFLNWMKASYLLLC